VRLWVLIVRADGIWIGIVLCAVWSEGQDLTDTTEL